MFAGKQALRTSGCSFTLLVSVRLLDTSTQAHKLYYSLQTLIMFRLAPATKNPLIPPHQI